MESVILGLLLIRPMTVYEINTAFKTGISLFFSASYGSIQATLQKLLSSGKITFKESSDSGRLKKTYTITEKGNEAFFTWINKPLPENKLEVNMLSKIYFLGVVKDVKSRRKILQDIQARIKIAETDLHKLDSDLRQGTIATRNKMIFRYQRKILDYGLGSFGFAGKWINDLLEEKE